MNLHDTAMRRKNNAFRSVPFVFEDESIQCPSCGESYLHHTEILINARKEDSDTGTCVHVSGIGDPCHGPIETRQTDGASMALSISPRRGGMLITFECECCDASPRLAIYQHKGQTCIQWYNFPAL